MQLLPTNKEEDILAALLAQATTATQIEEQWRELEAALKPLAESMAAVGAVVLPDDIEPYFP